MAWIKRNLLFVVGLAVSAALIAAGGWYAYSEFTASDAAYTDLTGKDQQLDQLVNSDPYPNQDNIQKAKDEQKRIEQFKASARARFRELTVPTGLDTAAFKSLLENTISTLIKDASKAGVTLPDKYSFTFTQQRKDLQLAEKTLGPMAVQLADISEICRVLYGAKVHSILYLKRTPITNEVSATGELLNKKVVVDPDTKAFRFFYEVAFEGFTSELGSVLAGFRDSPEAIIVKTLNVEKSNKSSDAGSMPAMTMDPARARYQQYGNRYTMMQQQAAAAAAAATATAPKGNDPVLDPKPLRFTVGLEIVKLAPGSTPAAAAGPANANR
jgi:hypothetical protein